MERIKDIIDVLIADTGILAHFTVDTTLHDNHLLCDICNSEIFFMDQIELTALVGMAHKHYQSQCPETRNLYGHET